MADNTSQLNNEVKFVDTSKECIQMMKKLSKEGLKASGKVITKTLKSKIPYTCFASLKSYFDGNDKQLEKFVDALKKGLNYVHSHTPLEIANAIAESFPSTEISTIEKVVARYKSIDAWTSDLMMTPEGFEKLQDVLKEANELAFTVDYETLVTTKYLD